MLSTKDIVDLEKKYSRYIFKKRLKLFIVIIFLLLTAMSTFYFLFYAPNIKKKIVDTNKVIKSKIEKTNNILQQKDTNFTKIENVKEDTNLTKTKKIIIPKKNISNMTEEIIKLDINNTNTSNMNNNMDRKLIFHIKPSSRKASNVLLTGKLRLNTYFLNIKNSNIKQKNTNTVKNINKNDTIPKEKDVKTKIHIVMKDINSIQYLKNKFQKTHDIVFALMLCENYYSQKNYRESLKWSIIANDIDSQSERSWMWFAKSKYKLNKREDAIKALKAFLKSNESKNIRLLLRDIVNGELND